jgi:hypothetical protein
VPAAWRYVTPLGKLTRNYAGRRALLGPSQHVADGFGVLPAAAWGGDPARIQSRRASRA